MCIRSWLYAKACLLLSPRKSIFQERLQVDFFAGSGTTLNAVNLLNDFDGLNRRCIIITNNEVSKRQTNAFKRASILPGSQEWESKGICQAVTWPRTKYTILGRRANGDLLSGEYSLFGDDEERKMSDGLEANVAYFRLGFVDKNSVSLGRQFRQMLPLLWMKAGSHGKCPSIGSDEEPDMMILPENRLAILVDDTRFADKDMASNFTNKKSYQLYRDYIENFVIELDAIFDEFSERKITG